MPSDGGQVSEHTKEPWEADGSVVNGLTREPEQHWNGRCHRLGSLYRDADSARAVACVNAIAGIPDPAGFVAAADNLRNVAAWCLDDYVTRLEAIAAFAAYDKARGR